MSAVQTVVDVVSVVFLLLGSSLALVAGLGLVRFPDVLTRLHAGTKPQVAGVLLIMTGGAMRLWDTPRVWELLLVAVLQMLTAPLAAHMISRIAVHRRHVRRDLLVADDLGYPPPGGLPHTAGPPQGDEPADAPR